MSFADVSDAKMSEAEHCQPPL